MAPWLDQDRPHTPARSRRQVEGVRQRAGSSSQLILDLGCGSGRLLLPLAEQGHRVLGVDHDEAALARCRHALSKRDVDVVLKTANFLDGALPRWPEGRVRSPFHLVLLLGNTLMTVTDIDAAIALFRRIRAAVSPSGGFIIDDIPHDIWPELTSGRWQEGMSNDGTMQMVWDDAEPVFALRSGSSVRTGRRGWRLQTDDRLYRLWTLADLRLVARLAGLSEPAHDPLHGLIEFRRG